MRYLLIISLLICGIATAQQQGEVFKTNPSNPQENINIGYITVTRTMYGLTFEDDTIKNEYKNLVKTFFKERFNGYSSLKKYRLKIEKRLDGWYIEDKLIH